jgi:L-threonylcarbamoyladenylate synthase
MSKKKFFFSRSQFIFKKGLNMRIFYWDRIHDLIEIERVLKNSEIIAGYTDTVIGLFANTSPQAFSNLNFIKNREKKPYICLVNTVEKVQKLINPLDHSLLEKLAPLIWPGPITVIFRVSKRYQYAATNEGTIAIRIPNHKELLELLEYFDGLFSTSANISGQATPSCFEELDEEIKSKISGFVESKEKGKKNIIPSTIIKVEKSEIVVLRGNLSQDMKQKLIDAGFVL